MDRVVLVEVLGRRGEVVERVRLDRLPAIIGRAFSSDVILSDPHVDARHARLDVDETGALVLEDLGSVNGLRVGTGKAEQRLVVQPGATVRLGRTQLRIATADQPVPPALSDAEPGGALAQLWRSPRTMAGVIGTGLLLTMVTVWLGSYENESAGALAGTVLAVAGSVAIWAGLWALAGRLMVHQARYWHHVTLACLVFAVMWLTGLAGSWGSFFASPGAVGGLEDTIGTALIVTALVLHAGLATAASLKGRLLFAFGVTAGLGLLAWVGDTSTRDDYGSHVTIGATLKPVPASLVPAVSLERFLARTETMQRALEREE